MADEEIKDVDNGSGTSSTEKDDDNLVSMTKDELSSIKETISKLEANNQALMKEKVDARKAAEKARLEAAKTSGSVDEVNKEWEQRFSEMENSYKEKISSLDVRYNETTSKFEGMINGMTVGATATSVASKLALKPEYVEVLEPHIKKRLSPEIKDGNPTTRVLDANGRPSAMTIEELAEEFKVKPAFAALITGSLASGGGPAGQGVNTAGKVSLDKFNAMSPSEQAKFASDGGEILDN